MSSSATSERRFSTGFDHPFPKLKTAVSQDLEINKDVEINKEYKSGASYQGPVMDNKKVGKGTFVWPNGSKYVGEFMDNCRHGKGTQYWPDGSSYDGDFVVDMRHGNGEHSWANREVYTGNFFRDRRHGAGKYKWQDGSFYNGTFYLDKKEGYGTMVFADGTTFQGLYVQDERSGPGVMEYTDGSQDVGLWQRERLVKLCTEINGAFTMSDHPEFEYYPEEHKQYVPDGPKVHNRTDVVNGIVSPPEIFSYEPPTSVGEKMDEIFSDALHSRSLAMDLEAFDREFKKSVASISNHDSVKDIPEFTGAREYAWNSTPSCITIQRNIMKHRDGQNSVKFSVDSVIKGDRGNNCKKGLIEDASEDFLRAAVCGDQGIVERLLHAGSVYVDVADKKGLTALLGAATNWHQGIINCLLDNGADINKLNDEGVSALAACHIFYYPIEYFKYNIAERDLVKPQELDQEVGYDVNEAVKGILMNLPNKKAKSVDSRQSTKMSIDTKKISKLREEFAGERRRAEAIQEQLETGNDNETPSTNRKLGTLHVKRTVRINIDDVMAIDPLMDEQSCADNDSHSSNYDYYDEDALSVASDFESLKSVRNYGIEVSDQLIERCATALSTNEMVVSRERSAVGRPENIGTVRRLAMDKSARELMKTTIHLLLRRGANPSSSSIPYPVLFFAIKAADVEAVRLLLSKGASTGAKISEKKGGLSPLHIACAIPGDEGVRITELLLSALADPDIRATVDGSFLNRNLEEEWSKDAIDGASQKLMGGRTPLHIVCARDDNYRNACKVVHLLLTHHANPNLLCNGHSPLALCVTSGNDLAIDELLAYGADPCLPLTHGVGSALCVASSTEYEHRRTPQARLALIDKLIKAGADILAPIPIGPKRIIGTAVDYAYYMYNQDRRIAHMPYHALTHAERETFNARRKLLSHLGDILRTMAVERERRRIEEEEHNGRMSRSPSPSFLYTGAGASLLPGIVKARGKTSESKVSFGQAQTDEGETRPLHNNHANSSRRSASHKRHRDDNIRKPLLRYCYECGRSVGVRLSACTRCKEVYYCSKACKLKAWNARHKEECIRIGGRSPSPGKDKRIDSPTPATDPERGLPTTVAGITKLPLLQDTSPNVFMGKPQEGSTIKSKGQGSFGSNQSKLSEQLHNRASLPVYPKGALGMGDQRGKGAYWKTGAFVGVGLQASMQGRGRQETIQRHAYLDNYSFV